MDCPVIYYSPRHGMKRNENLAFRFFLPLAYLPGFDIDVPPFKGSKVRNPYAGKTREKESLLYHHCQQIKEPTKLSSLIYGYDGILLSD
jgi:hypothetical protein